MAPKREGRMGEARGRAHGRCSRRWRAAWHGALGIARGASLGQESADRVAEENGQVAPFTLYCGRPLPTTSTRRVTVPIFRPSVVASQASVCQLFLWDSDGVTAN